jgi:nitroreductase
MSRVSDHPVAPLFIDRWSPRSFTGEPIADETLATAFEAARWAPSAFNAQPWRFVIARPGEQLWSGFVSLLVPRNQRWAARASALVVIASATTVNRAGVIGPNYSHSFDTGAAWANFSHQLHLLGWHAHGIGGFDREAARGLLGLPDGYVLEAMVAVGKRAGLDELHADFHDQEKPSGRRPLAEIVFAGRFKMPAFTKQNETERNAA